jgi:hypothetical protein
VKRIYAVVWTEGSPKVLPTKSACLEHMRVWRKNHEEIGWDVKTWALADAIVATDPKTGEERAIVLHTYDAETKERIFPKVRKRPEPAEKKPARPRKSRAPAYA